MVQAEGAVAQAEARLRQLRELTLPSAEVALRQAQGHSRQRTADLRSRGKAGRDGFGTRATLDDATKSLDIARAQVRSAELQVFTSRPGGSDYVMAETQLNQARASARHGTIDA